jgi:hypothetical protein
MRSAHIEFDENAQVNTRLFELPFEGEPSQIEKITFQSNELDNALLSEYFELKFKTLILKKSYDLNKLESDFLELLFTCTSASSNIVAVVGTTNLAPQRMSELSNSDSYSSTFPLYIAINDINDKAPEFIGSPYKFSIKEVKIRKAFFFKLTCKLIAC